MRTGIPQNSADHFRLGIGEFASFGSNEADCARQSGGRDPFGFLLTDFDRRRKVGQRLSELNADEINPAHVKGAFEYISGALLLHLRIEEDVLFPMLRRYCLPGR